VCRPHRRSRSKHPSLNRPRTPWKSWRGGARPGAAGGRGKRGRSWKRWTATPSDFRGAQAWRSVCSAKIALQGPRGSRIFLSLFALKRALFLFYWASFLFKEPFSLFCGASFLLTEPVFSFFEPFCAFLEREKRLKCCVYVCLCVCV